MRDPVTFEVRVRRFGAWRAAVVVVAVAALAALAAWAESMAASRDDGTALPFAVAAALGAATVWAAVSLLRTQSGVLACHAGSCSFVPDVGATTAGALTVALDLGSFLLLRIDAAGERKACTWLPVQRRGLEREWHALRCAVYAPRRSRAGAAGTTEPPPR